MDSPLAGAPFEATLHLQFLTYRIDVRTNSSRLAHRLRKYFAEFLAPMDRGAPQGVLDAIVGERAFDTSGMTVWGGPRSGGRVPKETYRDADEGRLILKNRTGVMILLRDEHAAVYGELEDHSNQVVNLVGTMFGRSLMRAGYVMLHASTVVRRGTEEALIFLGNSGAGKSSVALKLIELGGYEYVSNDRVLMKRTGDGIHIVGLPKKPRVNPGTLLASDSLARMIDEQRQRAFRALSRDELWNLEEKHDVDVGRVFGAGTRLDASLERAFALQWRAGGSGLSLHRMDAREALDAMRVTTKDFGPYEPKHETPVGAAGFDDIAATGSFWAVRGRPDPGKLAALIATGGE